MPLPPLPDWNTPRYFLDYKGPQGAHTAQFRFNAAVSAADATAAIGAIVDAFKPLFYNSITFWQLRRSLTGTNLSFPIPWAQRTGSTVGVLAARSYPKFLSFVGRSSAGRRVRLTFIGVDLDLDSDYRVFRNEVAQVGTVVDLLNTQVPALCAKDGAVATWKDYANYGLNAYFQRKARRS